MSSSNATLLKQLGISKRNVKPFSQLIIQRADAVRIDVIGDGNCLPRALAIAGGQPERTYMTIRKLMHQELLDNRDFYVALYGDEIEYANIVETSIKDGAYLGCEHMQAFANAANVGVALHPQPQIQDNRWMQPDQCGFFLPLRRMKDEMGTFNAQEVRITHICWDNLGRVGHKSIHFNAVLGLSNEVPSNLMYLVNKKRLRNQLANRIYRSDIQDVLDCVLGRLNIYSCKQVNGMLVLDDEVSIEKVQVAVDGLPDGGEVVVDQEIADLKEQFNITSDEVEAGRVYIDNCNQMVKGARQLSQSVPAPEKIQKPSYQSDQARREYKMLTELSEGIGIDQSQVEQIEFDQSSYGLKSQPELVQSQGAQAELTDHGAHFSIAPAQSVQSNVYADIDQGLVERAQTEKIRVDACYQINQFVGSDLQSVKAEIISAQKRCGFKVSTLANSPHLRLYCTLGGRYVPKYQNETLVGNKKKSLKQGCNWQIRVNSNGIVTSFTSDHTHSPDFELLAQAQAWEDGMVDLAVDVKFKVEISELLATVYIPFGISCTQAFGSIQAQFDCKLIYADFVKVVNSVKLKLKPVQKQSSVQEMLDILRRKQAYDNWVYEPVIGPDSCLEGIVWSSQVMADNLRKFGDVVLIDSTYKKNSFDMPLVVVAVVNQLGMTIIAAAAVLVKEDTSSYSWLLNFLVGSVKWQPRVIFSDGDLAICKAIESLHGSVVHLLCQYHLDQNVIKNCSRLLGQQFGIMFKRFKQIRSLPFEEQFEAEMTQLLVDFPQVKIYFDRQLLHGQQLKYAKCYVNQYFTIDINTTGRVEGLNAALAALFKSNTKLEDVVLGIESLSIKHEIKSKNIVVHRQHRVKSDLDRLTLVFGNDLIRYISDRFNFYVGGHLFIQMDKSRDYEAQIVTQLDQIKQLLLVQSDRSVPEPTELEDLLISDTQQLVVPTGFATYQVNHRYQDSQTQIVVVQEDCQLYCTCGYIIRMGLPCRHVFQVWLTFDGFPLVMEAIVNGRWTLAQPNYQHFVCGNSAIVPGFHLPKANLWNDMSKKYIVTIPEDLQQAAQQGNTDQDLYAELKSSMNDIFNLAKNSPSKRIEAKAKLTQIATILGNQVQDPKPTKHKGRPQEKRKKSAVESFGKKRCTWCKQPGHSKVNCPKSQ